MIGYNYKDYSEPNVNGETHSISEQATRDILSHQGTILSGDAIDCCYWWTIFG